MNHSTAMKKVRTWAVLFIVALLSVIVLAGCGKRSFEKQLEGDWYLEGYTEPSLSIYSDGTSEIIDQGACEWSVVNDDQLKFVNSYGEVQVFTIVSLKNNCLTLEVDGENIEFRNADYEEHNNNSSGFGDYDNGIASVAEPPEDVS